MMTQFNCPACGTPPQEVVEERRIPVGRWSAIVEDTHKKCPNCGTEFYLPEQAQATLEKAINEVLEKHGLISGERVKALREVAGLTQHDFERVIGAPSKTVVRWESGAVIPNKTTSTFLMLLEEHHELITELAVQRGVALKRWTFPVSSWSSAISSSEPTNYLAHTYGRTTQLPGYVRDKLPQRGLPEGWTGGLAKTNLNRGLVRQADFEGEEPQGAVA